MKNLLAVLISLALFVGFTVSTASAGVYISGNLGAVFLNDADLDEDGDTGELTFDNGGVATFALGTTIGSAGRIEVELASRVSDFDEMKIDGWDTFDLNGDVTTGSFMGNVYYDFKNGSRFTPFIGGGLGFANVEYDIDSVAGIDDTDTKEDDDVVAYQIMLGGGFAATEQLSIDLQYRFFGTEDPDIDGVDIEYQSHNVMLGLRYSF
ncbi:MAG: hypothetical protein DRH06_03570 [Deltaproteobacteria bacterium]|nr:MAG: hypothetical protein DRH06_03570 [Deltaproteobacteria bacterium]